MGKLYSNAQEWQLLREMRVLNNESIGYSYASANASNAQGRSSIVQGWDLRSPTGETTKESRRSFEHSNVVIIDKPYKDVSAT
jgi:hypothetical protein